MSWLFFSMFVITLVRGIEVLNLKYNDQRLCCSMLVDLALREKFGNVASVEGSGLLWTSRVWKGEVRCPCNDCYHAWRNSSWMTCMFETVVQEEVTCSRLSQVGEDERLMSYKASWNILWSKRLQSQRCFQGQDLMGPTTHLVHTLNLLLWCQESWRMFFKRRRTPVIVIVEECHESRDFGWDHCQR